MLGEEAMKKMAISNVFLSGIGGLGNEIAKNIALAGVKNLTLHDTKQTTWSDLSTNFYLTPEDIGKNRAEVCIKQISQLNPYVKYQTSSINFNNIELSYFDQFKCVILTETPLNIQLKINDYCHSKGIRFISADAYGIMTWTFCDFGECFEIFDKDGEENKEVLIEKITQSNPGIVYCLNNEKHGFEDNDVITFREIQGMEALNGSYHKIKVLSPSSFSIGDTSHLSPYVREGIASQTKQKITISHLPLKESLLNPQIIPTDFSKFDNLMQLHIVMISLQKFWEQYGKFPSSWNQKEADEFVKIASKIIESEMKSKVENLNVDLLKKISFTAQGSLVCLTSFTGGVVAQECLKALSGKYTPLNQWMYLDAIEILPPLNSNPLQFQPKGNRLDGQVICLGEELCNKLANTKLFMIGCGAIGCEMLKNYAMLGVGTGNHGLITITDNDLIEKSNLNRQFLFRPKDIQKPKSESAANASKKMNPALKIIANLDKVGPETENKYSDSFFQKLDVVVNALDNVNARLYVDSRCVTNKKPLLESGTLGPKGHVQVIIPFKTESYGSQRDPPEKDVPFCTLKSFPNLIEHCIEWSRDFSFGGMFVSKPMQWNQLVEEENLITRLKQPNGGGIDLKIVRTASKLIKQRPFNFEDCISFARLKFETYYVNKTIQLLHNFPLDHKIDEKGTLFWTSPKRPPKIVKFDWNDELHRLFILSVASLWAEVWGISTHKNMNEIKKIVDSVKVPPFKPKQKKIETDENKKKEEIEKEQQSEENIDEILTNLATYFSNLKGKPFKLKVIEFEKDDDSNFHIDMIHATSNLRARMYSIPEVDRLRTKAIAGRIMPAIATTTASIAGCVSLELIKLVKGDLELDKFKNLFMNLALPFWSFTEPGTAEKKKLVDNIYYTLWDSWDIKEGDITLGEFLQYFENKYKLKIGGVFKGAVMVYVPMFPGHAKRKTQKMSILLKKQPSTLYEDLTVTFIDEKGEDISGPPIRFYYEK